MKIDLKKNIVRCALAGAVTLFALASPAAAQVVVIVNGAPITNIDIEQRTKLMQLITPQKSYTRQQILDDLINDQVKLSVAKRYTFELPNSDIDEAYGNMARNGRMTAEQLTQQLTSRGIKEATMKARLRAEITWNQLIRGKFASSLQIPDSEIAGVLRNQNISEQDEVGYNYTLYPVVYVFPRNSPAAVLDAKRKEAEALRARFLTCNDGLRLARAMRDVAVREPVKRSSADLNEQLRELLAQMEVGKLTAPEPTPQGIQMFALCDKKQTTQDSPAKRKVRDELFNRRFESEAKRYLDTERKQSMIEYR